MNLFVIKMCNWGIILGISNASEPSGSDKDWATFPQYIGIEN